MLKFNRIFAKIGLIKYVPIANIVDKNKLLYNKVAFITGGSSGIGFAIAKQFYNLGCNVIVAGTNKEKLDYIKKCYPDNRMAVYLLDYSNPELFGEKLPEIINIFGHLDVFVSSVGVHTENVDFFNVSIGEYERVMGINLKGTFFMCQSVSKYFIKYGIHGKILLISSSRGYEPVFSPYGLSKCALNGFTRGLAKVLAKYNISVNAIAPGAVATSLLGYSSDISNVFAKDNSFGRILLPIEVANVASFLVSDVSDMISGEIIRISGGRGTFDIR